MSTNLTMYRGDKTTFSLVVTQSGSAYDLTGATVRMTAKWSPADADNAAVFTVSSPSSGIVVTSAAGGLATITLSAAKTSSLPGVQINLYYDVQVTDGSGNPFTVVDGTLTVNPDVSITTP